MSEQNQKDASTRLVASIKTALAQEFRNNLSDMVKRGMEARAERGWFLSTPPLGYINDRLKRIVVKDPATWGRVHLLWKKYLQEECSIGELTEYANKTLALKGRHSNKPLTREAIRRILTNPFYMGKFRYDGKLYDGKHSKMVTEDEFKKAQRLLFKGSNNTK